MFDTSAMTLAALFQETFYDRDGISIADSLSGIEKVLYKIYKLEKLKLKSKK